MALRKRETKATQKAVTSSSKGGAVKKQKKVAASKDVATNKKRARATKKSEVAEKDNQLEVAKSESNNTHYFNEKFDRVDQDQSYACISIVGPDVIQKAKNVNGDIHPVHGLVVWGMVASDSGPEADKMKAAASHACRGLLDVYIVRSCAMLPLKFSLEDFTLANTSWADARVEELMSGLRRSKQMTQQFFDERKEHLQNNTSNGAMIGEELDQLRSDLKKVDEEKAELQKNIAVYEAKLHDLK